jgi:alpha-beta hydrolase superfamily lysophospholipase
LTLNEFLQYVPFVRVFRRAKPDLAGKKNILFALVIEVLSLLGLYLLLSPAVAVPLYNFVIFHPLPENQDLGDQIAKMEQVFHCRFEEVVFAAQDGEKLRAWYFVIPGAKKTLLFSHGNGGCLKHRLALCPLLLQTGCSVFMYDYEGFGDSTGSASVPKICQDAVAAYDYLTKARQIAPLDVIAYGESIGAGVSSELSQQRKLGGIILQSPFTSLPEAGADKIPYLRLYPQWSYPTPTLNNLEILRHPHPPLLLIHGMKDDMLPSRYSQQIFSAAATAKTLVLLPHADHVNIYKTDLHETIPALNKFIAGMK